MILSFKPCFKYPILEGSKIHTIREDKLNRWKDGRLIHFSTGVRTKDYNCFKKSVCRNTQKITIRHSVGYIQVYINDKFFGSVYHHGLNDIYEYSNCLNILALNDGFSGLSEFFNWFNSDFEGKIIHWTYFKYW